VAPEGGQKRVATPRRPQKKTKTTKLKTSSSSAALLFQPPRCAYLQIGHKLATSWPQASHKLATSWPQAK